MAGAPTIDALLRQAVARHQQGDLAGAEAGYREAARLVPESPHPRHYLGLVALARGDAAAACVLIEAAIARCPDVPEFHVNLGNARKRLGQAAAAADAYAAALALRPGFLAAQLNLAALHDAHGDLDAALALLQEARAAHPQDSAPLSAMAQIFRRTGRWRDALAYSQAATEVPAPTVNAFAQCSDLLMAMDDWTGADRILRRAVRKFPSDPELLTGLGCAQDGLGLLGEAVRSFRAAIARNPEHMAAWANLAAVLRHQGRCEAALEAYGHARALAPRDPALYSAWLFTLLMSDRASNQDVIEAHQTYASLAAVPVSRRRVRPGAGRRLRVAYLSADLRNHPVGYFLRGVLEHHDAADFDIRCYHCGTVEDGLSEVMRAAVSDWVQCAHLSDDELAARIRDDQIDVLVDLSGHTAGGRLMMLAKRPAPIQLSYLGYAHPLHLPWIDGRISDFQADPLGAQREGEYAEPVHRVSAPYSYYCYTPPSLAPDVAPLPALGRGALTFGAFLQLGKLTPSTGRLWAAVLDALPAARLLIRGKGLGDKNVRAQLAADLDAAGIPRGRLLLEGWAAHDRHLLSYHQVDCMLDTQPFNLATNTCEALWMGVPTISLAGDRLSARMGASILVAAGLGDWVAADASAFVDIARQAAADLPRLAALRARLRETVAASALTDASGYTRQLEEIYRRLQRQGELHFSAGS